MSTILYLLNLSIYLGVIVLVIIDFNKGWRYHALVPLGIFTLATKILAMPLYLFFPDEWEAYFFIKISCSILLIISLIIMLKSNPNSSMQRNEK